MKLKYYRILMEGIGADAVYRIQERGWFRWNDVRVVFDADSSGMPLTKILRFNDINDATKWIENRMGRNESMKTVLCTYAVYG